MSRPHDIVVYGATGFTGRLVAQRFASQGLEKWAIAGRNAEKLEEIASGLPGKKPAVVVARADHQHELRAMCESTRVVLSCAGPFTNFGEPLVGECIERGTDYVDVAGDAEFVRNLIERYHGLAAERGVRVVPCCGFDSVPVDLGVWFTMDTLRPTSRVRVESYVQMDWTFSGGTMQSVMSAVTRGRGATSSTLPRAPKTGRRVAALELRPRYEPDASGWIIPSPMIDPQIVLKSASESDSYGPDFSYACYFRVASLPRLAALGAAAGTLYGLANVDLGRKLLTRLKPPGGGASETDRERGFFRITTVARTQEEKLITRVSGGDKYVETATMAGECARILTEDRSALLVEGGVWTPASAFGGALVRRLDVAGIRFEVVRRTKA